MSHGDSRGATPISQSKIVSFKIPGSLAGSTKSHFQPIGYSIRARSSYSRQDEWFAAEALSSLYTVADLAEV